MKLWMAGAVMAVGLAAAPPADACSWYDAATLDVAKTTAASRLVFSAYNGSAGEPTFEVLEDGSVVEGELSEAQTGIWVFEPAEPMALGTHTLSMTFEYEQEVRADFEVVAEEPALDVQLTSTAKVRQEWVDSVCCTNDMECFGSCGGCTTCWPSDYRYTRELSLQLESNRPVIIEAQISPAENANPRSVTVMQTAGLDVWGGALGAEETCVDIRILDAADQTELDTRRICKSASDFDESNLESPDVPELVAQCTEPPNDTEDPNWKRYGERSPLGCSTTSANPMLSALMLFGLLALRRRRQR